LALKPKLSIAGRLDKWASGLLILSQDGEHFTEIQILISRNECVTEFVFLGKLVNSIISKEGIAKKYRVDLKQYVWEFMFGIIFFAIVNLCFILICVTAVS
jgi:23S rRNA-/tRNA-specific pseudouridylate synthase